MSGAARRDPGRGRVDPNIRDAGGHGAGDGTVEKDTFPFLRASSERLAGLIACAEFVDVTESIGHRLDAEATTRVIAARVGG